MSVAEIVAIIASVITIIAFVFSLWQHVRLKAAEQALQSVRAISQAALIEAHMLQGAAKSDEEKAHYRTLEAFLVAVVNSCIAFLRVSRREMFRPSAREAFWLHMGELGATGMEEEEGVGRGGVDAGRSGTESRAEAQSTRRETR